MKNIKFLLSVSFAIFFLPITSFAGLVGLWNFDDSLNNSVVGGSPLVIVGSPSTSYANETINGATARVLQFSAFSSSQWIAMTNDASRPTRSYTIVLDVKFPTISGYTSFYDTDATGDGEFFVQSNGGGIGIGGTYAGIVNQGTWYRIAVVCSYDGSNIDMRKFIDGTFVGSQDNLDATRFSVNDIIRFFTDNDNETAAGVVNSVAFYDDAKNDSFISDLGGPTAGGIGGGGSAAEWVGLWNFDGSLTNSVANGAPLHIVGSPSTSYANETINGETARVLQFPAFSPSQWITMTNEAPSSPNTESYTLIFDIKFSGGWASFYKNDTATTIDGSFFLNPDHTIGIEAGKYAGTFNDDTWYRVAITYQPDGSGGINMRKYINGSNVGGTANYADAYTNQFILHNSAFLFTDNNNETHSGAINSLAFYGEVKDDAFISSLGGPNAGGIGNGAGPVPLNDIGPFVKYVDPYTVKVFWNTEAAVPTTVQYGLTDSLGSTAGSGVSETSHEVFLTNLECRTKYYYRINKSSGFSSTYKFDTGLNYSRINVSNAVSPYASDSLTPKYEEAAEYIISETGIEKGYCLVYGCGTGRLAFELAKRSDMIIVGVDTSESAIKEGRQKLISAGVYGSRVTLHKVSSLNSLKYKKWLFNLIVSDTMISDGTCPGSASEMFRVLRPSGGIGYFGQPAGCPNQLTQSTLENWLDAASLTYTTSTTAGLWSKVEREGLANAGEWPQQYGRANNAANSGDTLDGKTSASQMQVQWLGSPGADFGADRNPRMPAAVMCNGRIFHQGFDRIAAIDSYNGFIYWSMEIPEILRVNMPKEGSVMSADSSGLFIGYKNTCLHFDGQSGEILQKYIINNSDYEWGYVARANDKLYGTAQYKNAHYTDIWDNNSWYESTSGDQTYKVCGKEIFACNTNTKSRVWTYSDGVIINSTITIGGNRIYFVESRNSTVENYSSGRVGLSELWSSQYLVALNLDTGAKVWEKSINTEDGIDVFYMQYTDEKLFITASRDKYYIYAYNAANGNSIWSANHAWHHSDHSGHQQHPVIVGNKFYLVPNSYNINTGALTSNDIGVHNKCGTYSACNSVVLYRGDASVNMVMQDISSGGGGSASSWKWLRDSCWLSIIFGGQMILVPEGAGGCSCNGWINTSLGFAPKD